MSRPGPIVERATVASTDGVDVVTHDYGGDGPLVLFCHATGFCGRVWGPFIDAIGPRFHCVALDFRAHGATRLPDGVELVWSGMASDLLAVVDAFGPGAGADEPVYAVGHSMGGAAIILAETARPGTFERAWTFEPILLPEGPKLVGDEVPDIALAAQRRRPRFESRQAAIERWSSRPPLDALDERALRAYADHGLVDRPDGTVELACSPDHEASVFQHHLSGAYERSGELRIPIVVGVSGEAQGPGAWARSAATDHPHLTLVAFPDLTHFGPLEEPDRLAADAVRFLGAGHR
jgi:pimeloyl-ACP methyl ester carboxylesterase